jgi:cyclohexadienyl dehydratase
MHVRSMLSRHFLSTAVCIFVALIFTFSAALSHARPLSVIKADGVLKVGLTGDYAPFSLRDADGHMSGADVAMAQDLAKALGVALAIVPTTWKTLARDFQADQFDIAMGGISFTPDRAAIGDFSIIVLRDGKRPIVRCADKDRYVSIAAIDQASVRVAFNPGGTNERFDRANFAHATLKEYSDNRVIFDALAAGQADAMVTDGAEVDYQARRHSGILCPAAVADSFDHVDKAYWMTHDAAFKQAVDAWLKESLQSGLYTQALSATK